jgi:hypothetical protein
MPVFLMHLSHDVEFRQALMCHLSFDPAIAPNDPQGVGDVARRKDRTAIGVRLYNSHSRQCASSNRVACTGRRSCLSLFSGRTDQPSFVVQHNLHEVLSSAYEEA